MKYELAKQLKRAGFPQKDFTFEQPYGSGWPTDVPPYKFPYNPTLSELIAACGLKFEFLRQFPDGRWAAQGGAIDQHGDVEDWNTDLCPTPEEAVARLWLSLNSLR